jgi:hypothetical protein
MSDPRGTAQHDAEEGIEVASEQEEIDAAATEAAHIGGNSQGGPEDPALRPLYEAGEGEAEGFEEAEAQLIEHASHSDQQSAHAILHHQGMDEREAGPEDGEADHEHSSELDDDLYGEDLDEEELDEDYDYE